MTLNIYFRNMTNGVVLAKYVCRSRYKLSEKNKNVLKMKLYFVAQFIYLHPHSEPMSATKVTKILKGFIYIYLLALYFCHLARQCFI